MDLFDVLLHIGLVTTGVVAYLLVFRRSTPPKVKGSYRQPGWNYAFRLFSARLAVRKWKAQLPSTPLEEEPREQTEGWDCVTIRAASSDGATALLAIRKICGPSLAEVTVIVKLADGTTYKLPQHPDTLVGQLDSNSWNAGGLKIQVVEKEKRLRVLYNGLLVRDGVTQHCTFNFIWSAAAGPVRHPEDWSEELAAAALAIEPWRDHQWPHTLGKWGDGSWHQWGAMQGRFIAYDDEGTPERSEYLRLRGARERSWAPQGYNGLRRSVVINAAGSDGTAVQLRGFSYKDVLTVGFHGSVRFPNFSVQSITGTDLVLAEFCEHPGLVPDVYTFNITTANSRTVTVVLRAERAGARLVSGASRQHELCWRAAAVSLNGKHGRGSLELGYEAAVKSVPKLIFPNKTLRWLSECEAGPVGYCVPFEAPAAACPGHVGGKGASLALLASVQQEQGYKVPPGFCISTKALEKHLQANPAIREAIRDIEAANENYDEKNFREKCDKAVHLFTTTPLEAEVKGEIMLHLSQLRRKAIEQNLGPEPKFAVRSSAVGEDSEALSAAGQNETVLGCASEEDVAAGVRRCWGSMFAFTSAHYRRQNGQACACGGGVVVQALACARAAGVLFTRHPAAGSPARLLLTANYGLGETVVSGSVEPDTVIIKREEDKLAIAKVVLGSKKSCLVTSETGLTSQDLSEEERRKMCISEEEALKLAKIGVEQDRMWGAGRDIEWAITKEGIYLLQARPITSLERWTEEELLHELDVPIMADDELISFGNTGEVMPKPMCAISYDMTFETLRKGTISAVYAPEEDEQVIAYTHNRVVLLLYTTFYRRATEIDLPLRILEYSVFGHEIANETIIDTALHRNPPSVFDKFCILLFTLRYLITSGKSMRDTIKTAKAMNLDTQSDDPMQIFKVIEDSIKVVTQCVADHCNTSSASTAANMISMIVLVEGNVSSEFTPEQCNELNTLLSAGEVLSAEVPHCLAKIAKMIQETGKAQEFRAQDPKDALTWLEMYLPEVHVEVQAFLEKHGHRAIMEFDLATKPWVLVPEEMMKVLQNMKVVKHESPPAKTDAEIINSLKTPKKSSTRMILRWLLLLCRRVVRHREHTKAYLILALHKQRLALLQLGRALVRQWYLPDQDLVFHFRLEELREYIQTRDPALLKKAMQRQQHLPAWGKLKFAETNVGWVEPLPSAAPVLTGGDVALEATSVCGGEVIARACVVKDLSEISQLQQGDVLITHSTDIGWSPYFPLLSGIVTELGGLISHGAVIAREYGLPCIVGAEGATRVFRTGDTVRLAGARGLVQRVQLAEPAPAHT